MPIAAASGRSTASAWRNCARCPSTGCRNWRTRSSQPCWARRVRNRPTALSLRSKQQLEDRRIEAGFYKNPLFFTLLAGLWLDPKSGRRLPETRAELYRRSVDLLLSRWTRRRLPDASIAENLGLAPDRLRSVLETLACSVHEQSAPNQDTTLFHVKDLLGVLYDAGCEVRVRDVPDYLSQHTGLLTSPEHGWLYFTHRSFQEHLAACELVCRAPDAHLPPVAKDRRFPDGLLQRMLAQPELWENVARLAADELVVQGRMRELGSLLAAGVRPYLEHGQAPVGGPAGVWRSPAIRACLPPIRTTWRYAAASSRRCARRR